MHDSGDEALLLSLCDFMEDSKKIMDACSNKELDEYYKEYDGFYYLAKLGQAGTFVPKPTVLKLVFCSNYFV